MDSAVSAARARVQQAYAPELFQQTATRCAQLLSEHLRQVQAGVGPVLNWNEPHDNLAVARQTLDHPPAATSARILELMQLQLARGHNLHHPHYVGHQVPPSVPISGLFDAVGAVTNQVMAVYEMGPWATAVEQALVGKLLGTLGWSPETSAGIVTHGGAAANLTGLLVARNITLGDAWEAGLSQHTIPPVLVVQADAHYSMSRAAGVLGLGLKHMLKAPLDFRRRMDPQQLDDMLAKLRAEHRPVIAVVACACATPIGAFDPLDDIAAICRKYDVWLHIDAAHGGAAMLSPRHRSLLRGLEQADSLIWDAHKMMFVPALCAFVLYRRKSDSFRAFQQDAPYLFDASGLDAQEFDGGLRTLECTKRAAAYGLWGLWATFGEQLFSDLVDVTIDLGQMLFQKLTDAPDFVPLHEPQCNIIVFRHTPLALREATPQRISEFHQQLRKRVIQSGKFYLVSTVLDGVTALRVTLMNPLTTDNDLDELLQTLRETGADILGGK